jgi:uncharacterized protein (DUF2062 family)
MADPRILVSGAAFAVGSTTLAAVGAAVLKPMIVGVGMVLGAVAVALLFSGLKTMGNAARKARLASARERESDHPAAI